MNLALKIEDFSAEENSIAYYWNHCSSKAKLLWIVQSGAPTNTPYVPWQNLPAYHRTKLADYFKDRDESPWKDQ